LLELHEGNPFKIRSLQNASFKVERLPAGISSIPPEEVESIDGIGKGTSEKIRELLQRGSFAELDALVADTPPGVLDMLSIKGIGPKKVRSLWKELGVESIGELLYACNENRLVELKGFGTKTQEQIRHSIEYADSNKGKFHYAVAEALSTQLVHDLESSGTVRRVSFTGALRRKCEIIEVAGLVVSTDAHDSFTDYLKSHPLADPGKFLLSESILSGVFVSGLKFEIHLTNAEDFEKVLYRTTGSQEHFVQLKELTYHKEPAGTGEEEFFTTSGIPYLEPEFREGVFEFEWLKKGVLPRPVEYGDLRGILHNHTTYSDGVHSLEEMAVYCKGMGYDYLGICDHSQSAFYANGLKADRVRQQHEEIDRLNAKLAPFFIYKGIESDILNDGSLDYPDDVLSTFDFIVASVHSVLRMDEAKATARLIKAIENPYTTILGHPTGRLLLAREGYPLDMKKVIDACAANGVIIELNANPYRLDLDWRHIPYAVEKGVMISINPDAHRKEGYHDMHYGVCVARKGGLEKGMTFNALDAAAVGKHFQNRRK
jgi:DNA polymerase (family 10)